jgi:curli biogenesis system outer membrane secretion channel CsgG
MRRRVWWAGVSALIVAAVTAAGGPAVEAQSTRPTVALLDFEYGTVQRWWSGNWDIGKGIADMLVDELVNDGSFRVIERKRLDAVLAEQNFSNSERADPSAASMAQLGKVLGVKYLIVGSVTKFGAEEKRSRFSARAFGGGRYGVGNVGTAKGKANVAITARIIDTTTAEIMASGKGEGTSSRSGLLLSGGAAGVHAGVDMRSRDFRETILGEATEEAVLETADRLIKAKNRLAP